jgi:protein-disulfide isomerase
VSASPGERLLHDLSVASTVNVGSPASPEITMVMDPRCPHCQATWKALRDNVMKGSLHIRMVPIGALNSDNERAAAILLTLTDPLSGWDKYVVEGDKTALAGVASPAALAAVRSNHAVIDSWKIESTPYLVYRAKDGKVKVVQGEPDKVSVVLGDLGL